MYKIRHEIAEYRDGDVKTYLNRLAATYNEELSSLVRYVNTLEGKSVVANGVQVYYTQVASAGTYTAVFSYPMNNYKAIAMLLTTAGNQISDGALVQDSTQTPRTVDVFVSGAGYLLVIGFPK